MGIVKREFTYSRKIKLSSSDYRLAKEGRKTGTVRLGRLSVAKEIVSLTDGQESVEARILSVDNGRVYKELTDADAHMDGLESLEALNKDLMKFYGKIDPEQPMTVIHFRLLGSS